MTKSTIGLGLMVVALALCQYQPPGGGSGNATTINGAAVPASAGVAGTNGSGQVIQVNPLTTTKLQRTTQATASSSGIYTVTTDGSGDSTPGHCAMWGDGVSADRGVLAGGDGSGIGDCLVAQFATYSLSGASLVPGTGTVQANVVQLKGGARGTCNSSSRGSIWQTFGGTGVADTVAVCAKDGADSYAWRTIF